MRQHTVVFGLDLGAIYFVLFCFFKDVMQSADDARWPAKYRKISGSDASGNYCRTKSKNRLGIKIETIVYLDQN